MTPELDWQGPPVAGDDLAMVQREIEELDIDLPANLIFHEVWLDDEPLGSGGRGVIVWGVKGYPKLMAEYIPANPTLQAEWAAQRSEPRP